MAAAAGAVVVEVPAVAEEDSEVWRR